MRSRNDRKKLKIAVLGSTNVGKSAMIHQLFFRRFVDSYTRTTIDIHHTNAGNVDIEIVDCGYIDHEHLRKLAIDKCQAFVLVFSVQDKASFEFITKVRDELVSTKGRDVPYIVVGNKVDLEGRCVPFALADCLCSLDWETLYCEMSATDTYGVIAGFYKLFCRMELQQEFQRLLLTNRLRQRSINSIDHCNSTDYSLFFAVDEQSPTVDSKGIRKLICF